MALSISAKLKIKKGMTLMVLNVPKDFAEKLLVDIHEVNISVNTKNYNQVHWFVSNQAQMEKELEQVFGMLKADVICWIYFPKKTSTLQTDLTRDKGWEKLLKYKMLKWISLVSFDETWSTFGMQLKNKEDEKRAPEKKIRDIFSYIDTVKKKVEIPDDLALALQKNQTARDFFETLSFSNKKEYVEWIVTAKKEETRNKRIDNSIQKLVENLKNPSER